MKPKFDYRALGRLPAGQMAEPLSKTYWVNIYRDLSGASGSAYETRELADQMAGQGRIACKEIYVMPGEGLEDRK